MVIGDTYEINHTKHSNDINLLIFLTLFYLFIISADEISQKFTSV
jgi:hypothetical protein